MIVYIDLEHERLQRDDPERALTSMGNRLKIKYRLEDISGEPCLIVRYDRVNPNLLHELNVRAVVVSGNSTEFEHYPEATLTGLRAVLREAACPTIAFCGGSHILSQTYGATIGPMGQLPPGESVPDHPASKLAPGMIQERGFMSVRVLEPHPLFDGLGTSPVFLESHYWETKAPPPGFKLYASTDSCKVQMIGHESKPVYAIQFHPEFWDDDHPDGRKFLKNFFRVHVV